MAGTDLHGNPSNETRPIPRRRREDFLTELERKRMMRKLTLWHSRTFRPITTHEELEPIMASVGFLPFRTSRTGKEKRCLNPDVGSAGTELVWREYAFRDRNLPGLELKRWPRPRLPYPRLDCLHLMTYQAFFVSLEYYLGPYLVSNLFHVRSLPFKFPCDKPFEMTIRSMEDRVDQVYPEFPGSIFYRSNTLDFATKIVCDHFSATLGELSCTELANAYVRKDERREIELSERDESGDFVCLVPVEWNNRGKASKSIVHRSGL